MRRVLTLGAALGMLALAGPAPVRAQEQDQEPARATRAPTASEMSAHASRLHRRGVQLSRRVQGQLDEARRSGDLRLVVCMNDVLTQVNAAIRQIEQRTAGLQAAIGSHDDNGRNHNYSVLRVLESRLRELSDDSARCLGRNPRQEHRSSVTVTIDRRTPRGDPTRIAGDRWHWPYLPPPASPAR